MNRLTPACATHGFVDLKLETPGDKQLISLDLELQRARSNRTHGGSGPKCMDLLLIGRVHPSIFELGPSENHGFP